jgi:two-component system, NtrC family, sensor histidine kinase PilS
VALLAGSLAEGLRSAGARLEYASHEIRDLRKFNEYVINSLLSGLMTTDADGRILTFNRAASVILGISSAHEIRNPLASMSGSIQVLRQELPLSDEQAQLMDIVLRESERLNDTIKSFLAYARPQRSALARLDIRKIVQDAALLLRNSAEVREHHTIAVDVPAEPVWCEADENQVRQVIWNLATNGLRAMGQGGRLLLAAATDKDGSDATLLTVQDEGRGIPPQELDLIFQPFHSSFEKGSGLGLAIVHRIVTDYNGTINVSSKVGVGTIVTVRLPIRGAITVIDGPQGETEPQKAVV